MAKRTQDPFDAYIEAAAPFAQPILRHLRETVHAGCAELEEQLKWGHPSFLLEGKILCGIASFKAHCVFGFWHQGMKKVLSEDADPRVAALADRGCVEKLSDLPPRATLVRLVKEAVKLHRSGAPAMKRAKPDPERKLTVPDDLTAALRKNAKAAATFEGFSYSSRKEYVQWITEAKREETRAQRLATAIEWLAEGKRRNWKYENC